MWIIFPMLNFTKLYKDRTLIMMSDLLGSGVFQNTGKQKIGGKDGVDDQTKDSDV